MVQISPRINGPRVPFNQASGAQTSKTSKRMYLTFRTDTESATPPPRQRNHLANRIHNKSTKNFLIHS
jgi:hypothetical protein